MELTLQNSIKAFPLEKDRQYFLWVDRGGEGNFVFLSSTLENKGRGGVSILGPWWH